MKISLNLIRFHNESYNWSGDPAPNGVDELVEKIGVKLGAVEEIHSVADRYEGALVVRVVSCEDHPQADRLHVCKVDDGAKSNDVERDENGHIQVVCGAPNVHADMFAVWLPPGATVPSTYYDVDSFVLGKRELRGVMSNGMLASPKELAIGENHEGILELEEAVQPGTPFVDALNLRDDYVIDIENKMFTHRPDCFGVMGVAREIAGIQGQRFTSPGWYRHDIKLESADGPLRVEVKNEIPDLVPRFVAVPMGGVNVHPSPVWLQLALSKLGVRPINNIVDLTNYYMLLTGQPLHAYDYDKVVAKDNGADHATIVVRHPKQGEKLLLLNGKEIEPRDETIMIATKDSLIGVGGVMGGGDTEVDESTKNIILECANFDMYSVRRTSMAHGLFTDAVTRFNKGQSPLQNAAIMMHIVQDVQSIAGGKIAGASVDDNHVKDEQLRRGSVHPEVVVSRKFINVRLGLDLSLQAITELLENVEFTVNTDGDDLTVKAPFWRTDIEIPEDVVEEVGRLYGFDKLPLELPKRTITPAQKDPLLTAKQTIRTQLARFGANEVLTYSFVHGELLRKVGQNPEDAYKLSNALSPDLQYYRLSLTPSLLDKVHLNIKAGFDKFSLFEMGKNHALAYKDPESLPAEYEALALVYVVDDKLTQTGAAYFGARQYLDELAWSLGMELAYIPITKESDMPVAKPFDITRSAFVKVKGSERYLGIIGEFRASVRRALKLPVQIAGFEIDVSEFLQAKGSAARYKPLPKFPKVIQDVTFKVSSDMQFSKVYDFVATKLQDTSSEHTFLHVAAKDLYQPTDQNHKNITLRLTIASYIKTLTDKEVSTLLDQVAEAAKSELSAERV